MKIDDMNYKISDSWFKYSNIEYEAFNKCWIINSLKPMWTIKNLSKSSRFEE